MIDYLQDLHPVTQALLATFFTWGVTALGAALVFVAKDISRKVFDGMLGFASGVMIAASIWSLLIPAIEMSKDRGVPEWFPAVVGFFFRGVFLYGALIKFFLTSTSVFLWRNLRGSKPRGSAAYCLYLP